MTTRFVDVTERPDLYDWFYGEEVDDIPMYLALAQEHSEVLECGIGSGRIAIPFAEAGKTIYGIDTSTAMLNQLRQKLQGLPQNVQERVRVYQADMRSFDLGRTFSFVLVPFSTFNYLLSIADQKAALQAIRRHLKPGGTLVIEILSFSLFPHWLDNDTALRKVVSRFDPRSRKTIEMWRVIRFDSATQIVEQDRHFRVYGDGGRLEEETVVLWRNRFFLLGEMQLLLEATGFQFADVYGDCSQGPYKHSSEFAVVASRAT